MIMALALYYPMLYYQLQFSIVCLKIISKPHSEVWSITGITLLSTSPDWLLVLPFIWWSVQRIKEVGIRKVLGATAGNIVYLFSKEFIILIAIAFAIATPIAWYFMHQWLQDYVYRINISWWLFAASGLVAIIIALATISFQAIKAAIANPVKSLRTE